MNHFDNLKNYTVRTNRIRKSNITTIFILSIKIKTEKVSTFKKI